MKSIGSSASTSRRTAIIGGALALGSAGGIVLWANVRRSKPESSPIGDPALMDQGFVLLGQNTPDASAQAIGVFRRAVEIAPDHADAWGALALACAEGARLGAPGVGEALRGRASAAADKAFALDPRNAFAESGRVALLPLRGNWARIERTYRAALHHHPSNVTLLTGLSQVLAQVGRCRDAANLLDRAISQDDPAPALLFIHVRRLLAANRLEEADVAMTRAYQLYPTHAGVWFTRFYQMLYGGRADQALAFGDQIDARPLGIPPNDFALIRLVAQATISRSADDIDRAISANVAAAHTGSGFAENAIRFCSALGREDDAFAVADALYMGRGFAVPDQAFSQQQGIYLTMANRPTEILFWPETKVMRADARFEPLVRDIGLTRYWAQSGREPDYRRKV